MSARAAMAVANAALAVAMAIKAHIPGDHEDGHEDNTFGLPDGDPIRRKLRHFFRKQQEQVAGTIATIGHPLDSPLPRMGLWNQPMADTMTPILGVYYDKAGQSVRGRIGLDPEGWRVTDPHVHQAIKDQAFRFCKKTNATTDLGIAEARDAVRDQIARGLIARGQAIPELAKRVGSVFTRASKSRATLIARTEASRAVHEASILSAASSGVVTRKHWLLSANACPYCHAIAAAHPLGVPLEGEFGRSGHDPDYSSIRYPPLHPNCRCSITLEVDEEPPHHEPEKEKEKAKEQEARERQPGESSGGGSGGGGGGRLPSPASLVRRVAGVARTGRRVAAFVAVPAVVAGTQRQTIRRVVERARRKAAERREREKVQTGGGMQPTVRPPGPTLHQVAAPIVLIPAGLIQDRIKLYMEGAGKAKLERLAGLDDAYITERGNLEVLKHRATKGLDKLRKSRGYGAPQAKAAEEELAELERKLLEYQDLKKLNQARTAEILAVPPGEGALIATSMTTKGRAIPGVTREAEGWLGTVLAGDPSHPKGIKVEYGALKGKNTRAHYDPDRRRVNLCGKEFSPVIVHEIGHAIEHQWSHVLERSAEFLEYRTKGETIRKLSDRFPGWGFNPFERGRKDRFDEAFDESAVHPWYVGKEYRTKARDPKSRHATEILSMGMEKIMTDPVKFAKKDPEYCAYVLGILDGSLR